MKQLIKKLFPGYKTKSELLRRIAFLEGALQPTIVKSERKIERILSSCVLEDGESIEVAKYKLSYAFAEYLKDFAEFEVQDGIKDGEKVIAGTIYAVVPERSRA